MNNIKQAGKCIVWHVYMTIANFVNCIVHYVMIKSASAREIENIIYQLIFITVILFSIQLYLLHRAGRHLINSESTEIDGNVDTDEIITSRERLNRMIQNPE